VVTPAELLSAALRYAELGYRVFPCAPGNSTPLTDHGFLDATTEVEQIERWWGQHPTANVAIATAGLLVVDLDPAEGNAANPWLKDDPDKQIDLAAAPTAMTPRGGRHHVFRKPAGKGWRCTASRLAPKVDTRTDGGYIVVPPSWRPDGAYSWVPGLELDGPPERLPEPPSWLASLLDALPQETPTLAHVAAGGDQANPIPEGQRNATLARLGGNMRRVGMTLAEIAAALLQTNKDRCAPPLSPREVERIAASIARYEPDQIATAMAEGHWDQLMVAQSPQLAPVSLTDLVAPYPDLRRPVIHGLLPQGETMNVIAASKTGKSWLVIDLALAVATGRPWLDTFETDPGNVLIIDNELHSETSANRIPKVAAARRIRLGDVGQGVFVQNLRGHWQDIFSLGPYFRSLEPGRFRVIILDAMYRFMPREMDENDNGTMANVYNAIDRYADLLGCCFVLIHHTSKGNQSGKAITDVGAGAGSQSRATDTHLVLRPHEEDDVVVLEAAVRSWPPMMPRCLRWAFPVWLPADDLDPTLLRSEQPKRTRQEEKQPDWDAERFTSTFVGVEPKLVDALLVEANRQGINDFKCRTLLRKAEAVGLVYRWDMGRGRLGYATQAPPHEQAEENAPGALSAKRLSVEALLRQSPELSAAEVANLCGVTDRYVRRLRAILSEASPEQTIGTPGTSSGTTRTGTEPGTGPGTESGTSCGTSGTVPPGVPQVVPLPTMRGD
jgi:hypothetical protein